MADTVTIYTAFVSRGLVSGPFSEVVIWIKAGVGCEYTGDGDGDDVWLILM